MDEDLLELLNVVEGKFKYSEFDSRNYCPLCLIKKGTKVRHVKRLNLCVKSFHFYSKFFDKLVFDNNYRIFVLILVLNFLLTILSSVGNIVNYCFLMDQPFWMYIVDFVNDDFIFWQKFNFAFNFMMLFGFAVDIFVQVVCVSYNLTYDELFRPQYYPYLYKKIPGNTAVYENPNGKGFINNWKAFLKRMIKI